MTQAADNTPSEPAPPPPAVRPPGPRDRVPVAAAIALSLLPNAILSTAWALKEPDPTPVALAALGWCFVALSAAGALTGFRWSYEWLSYLFPCFALKYFLRGLGEDSRWLGAAVAFHLLLWGAHLLLKSKAEKLFPLPRRDADGARKSKTIDPLEWTRDNVEAIVVAFLMALIIRCFCVEVFKIPTGSMEPTLLGDTKPGEVPAHVGDRIMVDKVGLLFHDVERFDVCVFKYPLDRSRNFIKRIVGLPGEDLMIDYGDLWVRPHGAEGPFRLARKPEKEQRGIWLPVWPDANTTRDHQKKMWDGGTAECFLGGNVFDTAKAGEDPTFRWRSGIYAKHKGIGAQRHVHDLRLSFALTLADSTGAAIVRMPRSDGYGTFLVTIRGSGEVAAEWKPTLESKFDLASPPPAPVQAGALAPGASIEVANYDGAIRVRIGRDEVLSWVYADACPEYLREIDMSSMIEFGSRGSAARFEAVTLGRDIHYFNKDANVFSGRDWIEIPAERYLAIGDNVGNSKDSRLWRERVVKLKDGRVIAGDYDSQEHFPSEAETATTKDGLKRFRDLDGTDHFFREEDVEDDGSGDPKWHPFVAREELVGKALIVWWPVKRFKMIR